MGSSLGLMITQMENPNIKQYTFLPAPEAPCLLHNYCSWGWYDSNGDSTVTFPVTILLLNLTVYYDRWKLSLNYGMINTKWCSTHTMIWNVWLRTHPKFLFAQMKSLLLKWKSCQYLLYESLDMSLCAVFSMHTRGGALTIK